MRNDFSSLAKVQEEDDEKKKDALIIRAGSQACAAYEKSLMEKEAEMVAARLQQQPGFGGRRYPRGYARSYRFLETPSPPPSAPPSADDCLPGDDSKELCVTPQPAQKSNLTLHDTPSKFKALTVEQAIAQLRDAAGVTQKEDEKGMNFQGR